MPVCARFPGRAGEAHNQEHGGCAQRVVQAGPHLSRGGAADAALVGDVQQRPYWCA